MHILQSSMDYCVTLELNCKDWLCVEAHAPSPYWGLRHHSKNTLTRRVHENNRGNYGNRMLQIVTSLLGNNFYITQRIGGRNAEFGANHIYWCLLGICV